MPEETARVLRKMGVKKAGVLATDGTKKSGIYEKALCKYGIEPVYPSGENQRLLMRIIYDYVKAGKTDFSKIPIENLLNEMKTKGAEKLILGCTELPVAFQLMHITENTIDPTAILARAAILAVDGKIKKTA